MPKRMAQPTGSCLWPEGVSGLSPPYGTAPSLSRFRRITRASAGAKRKASRQSAEGVAARSAQDSIAV